jgi:hypothetical protein
VREGEVEREMAHGKYAGKERTQSKIYTRVRGVKQNTLQKEAKKLPKRTSKLTCRGKVRGSRWKIVFHKVLYTVCVFEDVCMR